MAVASPWHTQCRVIYALILREIHTLYGDTSIGYAWALIQTATGVAIFWGLRSFIGMVAPHGMTVLAYLAIGFGIWSIISDGAMCCMYAVMGNRALLTFPQVTPLDIMVARVIVRWSTEVACLFLLLWGGMLFDQPFTITNPGLFLFVLIDSALLALGLGTTLSALAVLWKTLYNLIPIIFRLLFFMSGIFFSVSMFANKVGEFLLWNPILQLIELGRESLANGYEAPNTSVPYLCWVTLFLLTLGLLLERFVRKRDEDQ